MGNAAGPDLKLLYDIARSRLDTQLSFLDSLDTKLGLFLSVGAAIYAVAAAIVAVDHSRWSGWTIVAFAVATAGFIAVAFWTITALRQERWGIGPRVTPIAAILHRHGEREATKAAVNTLTDLYAENEPAYKSKVGAILPVSIALAIQTVASAAALASVARP